MDATETKPDTNDTDGDKLVDGYDGWETVYVGPGAVAGALNLDTDGDGLRDSTEVDSGMIPVYTHAAVDTVGWVIYNGANAGSDTDLDGRDDNVAGATAGDDADEVDVAASKSNDQDGDYLFDGVGEDVNLDADVATTETKPKVADTDGDGLNDGYDGWETVGVNVDGDADADALDTDTDGDGLNDGDEVNTWRTSALLTDTDGDGRNENTGNENNSDANSDGIINALSVDSDGDWYLDGSGSLFGSAYPGNPGQGEDTNNNGAVDAGETDPTTPNDRDGDGLPDWVELSFGTDENNANTDGDGWNDAADPGVAYGTGRQFYPDMSGNYYLIGETDGAGSYYTTDPRQSDTDGDGLNDDADLAANGNPLDYDTDNDGLSDSLENANGLTVNDVDTDADGIVDGAEYNADVAGDGQNANEATNADIDGDGIPDGVEFGITANDTLVEYLAHTGQYQRPAGAAAPALDQDEATYTDMNAQDTDGDGFNDGDEDADQNGKWKISASFHYMASAAALRGGADNGAAAGDETNPLDPDTDHGGIDDGTENAASTNALDATEGDRMFQVRDSSNAAPVNSDTLFIDPLPGDTGYVRFTLGNSYGIDIDSLYVNWTDLVWFDTLAYYPVPESGAIFSASWLYAYGIDEGHVITSNPYLRLDAGLGTNGLANNDTDTVVIVAQVPWGAKPGYYQGRVVLWYGTNPIDTLVLVVRVDGTTDLDIADWDSLSNGVGASDQDSTGAIDNVMNLAFAIGQADTGIFFISNPNLYPDTDDNDTNDVNGYPAIPQPDDAHFHFDPLTAADSIGGWDPDSQGNMHAQHVEYGYINYLRPTGVDSMAVEGNVTIVPIDTLALGSYDSTRIEIDGANPTLLPLGEYYGVVYVWNDLNNNGVYDGPSVTITDPWGNTIVVAGTGLTDDYGRIEGASFDYYFLKFKIMSPDIDVVQGQEDIDANNTMVINVPKNDVRTGIFVVSNPNDSASNYYADAWDGPGNERVDSLGVYDPDQDTLIYFPATIKLYRLPDYDDSIEVVVDGPDHLESGDISNQFTVTVHSGDHKAGVYTTKYTALNPVTTNPSDSSFFGKIVISGVGRYTAARYVATDSTTYLMLDWFNIRVAIGEELTLDLYANGTYPDSITTIASHPNAIPGQTIEFANHLFVKNLGNVTLTNIHFVPSGIKSGADVPFDGGNFAFSPDVIGAIASGDSAEVVAYVTVPQGQVPGVYSGWIYAYNDNATAYDSVFVAFEVDTVADIDISDNTGSLYGNTMRLVGDKGETTYGFFDIYNPATDDDNVDAFDGPSNVDVDVNLTWGTLVGAVDSIPHDSLTVSLMTPFLLPVGEGRHVQVTVNVPNVQDGTYSTWVVAEATAGSHVVRDSFRLDVVVGREEDIDIDVTQSNVTGNTLAHGVDNQEIGSFVVVNTDAAYNPNPADGFGNTDLNNVLFTAGRIVDNTNSYVIPEDKIHFNPYSANIPSGDSVRVFVTIDVPAGQHAGTYSVLLRAADDDGEPWDTITATFDIAPTYDIDVADNLANLSANTMVLSGYQGDALNGAVYVVNPNSDETNVDPDVFGNADLDSVVITATDLVGENYLELLEATNIAYSENSFALVSGASRTVNLTVNVPSDQRTDIYDGEVYVTAYAGGAVVSADTFALKVAVGQNEMMAIRPAGVEGVAEDVDSLSEIGTIYVVNTGYTELTNLGFEAQVLVDSADARNTINSDNVYVEVEGFAAPVRASEAAIDNIEPGDSAAVTVYVLVPAGQHEGVYRGALRVMDDDGVPAGVASVRVEVPAHYDIDVADNLANLSANTMVLSGYQGDALNGAVYVVNPNSDETNVDPDVFGNADLDSVVITATDLVGENYLELLEATNIAYSENSFALVSGASRTVNLTVNVPSDQRTDIYDGEVYVTAYAGGAVVSADTFALKVAVGQNEMMAIRPAGVEGVAEDVDSLSEIGTIYVVNTGYTELTNLGFEAQVLVDSADARYTIASDNIYVALTNFPVPVRASEAAIDNIEPDDSAAVTVYVLVPAGQHEGVYRGYIRVMDDDGVPMNVAGIRVEVPAHYDIDVAENEINASEAPTYADTVLFHVYNPNSADNNVDPDRFGNAALGNITYTASDLVGDSGDVIPAANITVTGPAALESGENGVATVVVTIPAGQISEVYHGYVYAEDNTAGVIDSVLLNVHVLPVEALAIDEDSTYGTAQVGDTLVDLTVFTVRNNGNIALTNLGFTTAGLATADNRYFIPPTSIYLGVTDVMYPADQTVIDRIEIGGFANVRPYVKVDRGQHAGDYLGAIRVIDDDGEPSAVIPMYLHVEPYYDLDIADYMGNLVGNRMIFSGDWGDTLVGSFYLVNPNNDANNVDPDLFGNDDLNNLTYTVTTLLYNGGVDSIPASYVTVDLPSELESGDGALVTLRLNVPDSVIAGSYYGWVKVEDATAGVADSFEIEVVVGSNEDLNIVEDTISNSATVVTGQQLVQIGTITVVNTGNANLDNIEFVAWDLRNGDYVIPADDIRLASENFAGPVPVADAVIDTLAIGQSVTVDVYAPVTAAQHEGTYVGKLMAIDDDGYPNDDVVLVLNVGAHADLDIAQDEISGAGDPGTSVELSFQLYNPNSDLYNVDPDPYGNVDLANIVYTVTDLNGVLHTIPSSAVVVDGPSAVASGAYADVTVTVNIPAFQYAETYTGQIVATDTVENVADTLTVAITVNSVEDVDIVQDQTTGNATVTDTMVTLSAFTVVNPTPAYNPDPDGPSNTDLDNLQFNTTGLAVYDMSGNIEYFIAPENIYLSVTNLNAPANNTVIDQLPLGQNADVVPYVYVTPGQHAGTYTGIIRVIDDDGAPSDVIGVSVTIQSMFDLDIADNIGNVSANEVVLEGDQGETVNASFYIVNPNSDETNADPDQFGNDDLNNLAYSVADLTYQGKLSYTIPADSVEVDLGGTTLESGEGRLATLSVHILSDQVAGTYEGWVYVYDSTTVGVGATASVVDSFKLTVNVTRSENIDVVESSISGTGTAGDTLVAFGTITVVNTGNVALDNLVFEASDLVSGSYVILGNNVRIDTVPVNAASIPYLGEGDTVVLPVSVLVAAGQHAGNYTGTLTVKDDDGTPFDVVELDLRITPAYDLDVVQNEVDLGTGTVGSVLNGTVQIVNPNNDANNADPDPFGNDDLRPVVVTLRPMHLVLSDIKGGKDGKFTALDSVIPIRYISVNGIAELASGEGTTVPVTVTLPTDTLLVAGRYEGWVIMTGRGVANPRAFVSDSFKIVLHVAPYDSLDILEDQVTATVDQGETATLTFTVENTGNEPLNNIALAATDLVNGSYRIAADDIVFDPAVIGALGIGEQATVTATVPVAYGLHAGTYTGTFRAVVGEAEDVVNVAVTVNPSYDLDIEEQLVDLGAGHSGDVLTATYRLINPNSDANNVDPDPYGNAPLTGFAFTATDLSYEGGVEAMRLRLAQLGYAADKIDEILTTVDSTISASAVNVELPTTLESGEGVDMDVTVTLPNAMILAGRYVGTVIVTTAEGAADTFDIAVEVLPEPALNIVETSLSAGADQGTYATVNLTVENIGNTDLTNIELGSANVPEGVTVTFEPPTIASLRVGESVTATARIDVAMGVAAGTYTIPVYAVQGPASDTVVLTLTVNPSYDLDIADNEGNLNENTMTFAGEPGDSLEEIFVLVNPNGNENNVDPDPFGNAPLTGLTATFQSNEIPSGAVTFADLPNTLASGAVANVKVQLTVPRLHVGTYSGTVIVTAAEGVADTFNVVLNVEAVENLTASVDTLELNANDGDLVSGSFYITNTGNNTLGKIELVALTDLVDGLRIPVNNISFEPAVIDSLESGDSTEVTLKVAVPSGLLSGDYAGEIMVMEHDGRPSVRIPVIVYVTSSTVIGFDENPVTGDRVTIRFQNDPTYAPKLRILNLAGDEVYSASLPVGATEYTWMLENSVHNDVASGTYIVIVETQVNGTAKVVRQKILILR